ncbi:MAG TPA: zf-HC2 domain-containing protein [Bryobacteraceae bacterium]|nr:zf-HC2 domain-containing protein [Bryobacteraceae bacterium]
MECPIYKQAAEIAIDYCAGTLESGKRSEFERHLESCTECSRVVNTQREVWETLDRWTPPEVSRDFDALLYASIARHNAAPVWVRWLRRIFQPPVPIAAWKPAVSLAAACAVLAAGLLVRAPHPSGASQQMRADHIDIEQVQSALDDIDVLMPPASSSGAM